MKLLGSSIQIVLTVKDRWPAASSAFAEFPVKVAVSTMSRPPGAELFQVAARFAPVLCIVMCTARLQAVGQAKPGPIRPSQAGPKSRPDYGFGPA